MELLQPRRVYQRANSDDPQSHDAFEMGSISTGQKRERSDYSPYDSTPSIDGPVSEYNNDSYPHSSDQDDVALLQPSRRATWLSGWRSGAYTAACIALISLITNITAAVWLAHHPSVDNNLVQILHGSCRAVSQMDMWTHLLINAISTLLLGGSNYCMQCLCAPNRPEIDKAHAMGNFLDIGVPSYHNLKYIAWPRVILWWVLVLSSLPLHLMYNSAFYSSLSTNNYNTYFVTSDFLRGGNATYPVIGRPDQYDRYGTQIQAMELQYQIANNDTLIDGEYYVFDLDIDPDSQVYAPFDWICTSDPDIGGKLTVPYRSGNYTSAPCDSWVSRVESIADQWAPWGYQIEYCVSEVIEKNCSFNGNLPILIIVIVANAVKLVVMLMVARCLVGDPLITIGDVVQSFLDLPDTMTVDMCYLTRDQATQYANRNRIVSSGVAHVTQTTRKSGMWKGIEEIDNSTRTKSLEPLRWSNAASLRRWTLTIDSITAAVLVVSGLLGGALTAIGISGVTITGVGFGKVHPGAVISGWSIARINSPALRIIAAILIANTPQLVLSLLYLNLNGLLTSMFTALEWSRFATIRKSLRVSTPKGQQRSTHFLQLPYKVAIPLMTISGILHWLLSQSIFLAVVAQYDSLGKLVNPTVIASCGFSPIAMIVVLVIGALLIVGCFAIGRLRYDPSIPMAGTCSIAISAACHRPQWDVDASTSRVQWGVIPDSDEATGIGHCSFSSGPVEPVQEGKKYMDTEHTQ